MIASTWPSSSGWAEVTSAVISPRWRAASVLKARMTLPSWASRRLRASTPRKLAVIGSSFIASAAAATARTASSRPISGLVVSARKSSDSASACFTAARLCADRVELLLARGRARTGRSRSAPPSLPECRRKYPRASELLDRILAPCETARASALPQGRGRPSRGFAAMQDGRRGGRPSLAGRCRGRLVDGAGFRNLDGRAASRPGSASATSGWTMPSWSASMQSKLASGTRTSSSKVSSPSSLLSQRRNTSAAAAPSMTRMGACAVGPCGRVPGRRDGLGAGASIPPG